MKQNQKSQESDSYENLEVYFRIRPFKDPININLPKIPILPDKNLELFEIFSKNIKDCFNGYNLTIMAYGQTSSGKTFTMLGPDGQLSLNQSTMGLIPQTCQFIFSQKAKIEDQIQVTVGYYEIYQNKLKDLISGEQLSGNLQTITLCEVNTSQQILEILYQGTKNRFTAKTDMNEHSSRSHAIFEINIEKRVRSAKNKLKFKSYSGKINLVDLAGSEDISKSGAQGERLKEACKINSDLFHLHRVIEAIVNKQQFIPFRDSNLTRMLQDSLSGQSRTIFIAHLSADPYNQIETLSTINQAMITQKIQTSPQQSYTNVTLRDPMQNDYMDEVHNKQTVSVQTQYGQIFCRISGTNNQSSKLIFLIHGSGPENSSMWWNYFVEQFLQLQKNFFYLQIDCPGYGRSTGDKQTIRSYPSDLIQCVMNQFGYNKAYCLIGSSQGAASIFNAVVEKPNICDFFAVMDPVSHDPQRFSQIQQFATLVYDTEDAGHPVKVGRIVNKIMQNKYYYEFTNSQQPNYLKNNFVEYVTKMFDENDGKQYKIPDNQYKIIFNNNQTLEGGILSWTKPFGRELNWYDENYFIQIQADIEKQAQKKKINDLFGQEEVKKEEQKEKINNCSICQQALVETEVICDLPCDHRICLQCCKYTLCINKKWCPLLDCQKYINTNLPIQPYSLQKNEFFITFGNQCTQEKNNFRIKPFVKDKSNIIKSVAFDINPQYPKSAIRVESSPFEIERVMQGRFPCNFKIKFKDENFKNLFIDYTVQQQYQLFERVLLVRLVKQKGKSKDDVLFQWESQNGVCQSVVDIS